jgi:sec-independent protein translocase protein TatA
MPGFVGFPELLLLGLVALLLFGPKRLPEMGRGLGKGLREFKDSVTGDHHDNELTVPQQLTVTTADERIVATASSTSTAAESNHVEPEPVAIARRDVA